jgi:glutathione S-transferase
MRLSGLEFEVERVSLYEGASREQLLRFSPSGQVPVLLDGETKVWDSFAIINYLLRTQPGCIGWPSADALTAEAMSLAAEMHSGFFALRKEMPMNIRRRKARVVSVDCQAEVARIQATWLGCRQRFAGHGPWLFGDLSIADVMYAPVASRFRSYRIPFADSAAEYRDAVLGLPAMLEWGRAAEQETERINAFDV